MHSDEHSVVDPQGQEYVVRVVKAIGGSAPWWKLLRRKRWQVEVYRRDRLGVEHPPVLQATMTTYEAADARAHRIRRDIAAGRRGWSR
jgi:hypothetical protein